MYYMKWAWKNIMGNRSKYVLMMILTAGTVFTLMLFDAVITGYEEQTALFQRALQGDIRLSSGGEDDLSALMPALAETAAAEEGAVLYPAALLDGVRLLTDSAETGILLAGITDAYMQQLLTPCTVLKEGQMSFAEPDSCLVDADTAEKLSLKAGDEITLYFEAPSKHIITMQMTVAGIFISNYLIHAQVVYLPFARAAGFMEKNGFMNTVIGTIAADTAEKRRDTAHNLAYRIGTAVKNAGLVARVDVPAEKSTFSYFQIFGIFKTILIGLKNITGFILALMLLFAVKNAYYLIFYKRKAEIAALMTYGMEKRSFMQMIIAETFIVLFCAAVLAAAVSIPVGIFLHGFPAARYSANLVAVFGGPAVFLRYRPEYSMTVSAMFGAVNLAAALWSMHRSVRKEAARLSSES
ncbi:MAG: FtsX-like permease family protein [Treponema sp.]